MPLSRIKLKKRYKFGFTSPIRDGHFRWVKIQTWEKGRVHKIAEQSCSVADTDPGSGAFLTLDPGSGTNIPDPQHCKTDLRHREPGSWRPDPAAFEDTLCAPAATQITKLKEGHEENNLKVQVEGTTEGWLW